MTREEAIRELKQFSGTTRLRLSANFWEALNRAIKLLEQEPCEDAISRRAVLNTLDFTDKFLDETRTVESYKTLLEECYKNLPSVTPTRKKGKWIRYEEQKPLKYGYELIIKGKCSNCGEVFGETYKMKCCPNCFAEMESKE